MRSDSGEQETQALAQVCGAGTGQGSVADAARVGDHIRRDQRFRLKVAESGVERSLTFRSLDEAEEVKADLCDGMVASFVAPLAKSSREWLAWCVEVRGIKPITIDKLPQDGEAPAGRGLWSVHRERRPQALPAADRAGPTHTGRPPAAATHHLFLRVAKRLWDWGCQQGYCRTNPWRKCSPQAGPRRESRSYASTKRGDLKRSRWHGRMRATYRARGAADGLPGLRRGGRRVARDIDDGGRVLWVPSGKTKNAKRRLKVPEHLHSLVLAVVKDKRPDELIFYPAHRTQHSRQYYIGHVRRLCRLADVPEVVPHSLRGLHATLALEGGATADAVAKALGHSSFATTAQHYASPSSVANSRSSRVAQALGTDDEREELHEKVCK